MNVQCIHESANINRFYCDIPYNILNNITCYFILRTIYSVHVKKNIYLFFTYLNMSVTLNKDFIKSLSVNSSVPIVLRNYVSDWSLCQWDAEKWCTVFKDKVIPFRCFKKNYVSDEPIWERRCKVENISFRNFFDKFPSCDEWMYFDYKYLHQWFDTNTELYKEISWEKFGYPEKGACDTTLWAGSEGAHTPAHQDTYGVNIVAQVHGKKRWILFPPETGGLRSTRVPYEESTVYSELNFYSPIDLAPFEGLTGGRMVELASGDALLVPRGWWHYVQNIDPLNIALNVWIPHEKDTQTQISEALVRILVTQVCKDLPKETARLIINPNEDCITTTPLSVFFLQLDTVVKSYLSSKRKTRRYKRQRTCEEPSEDPTRNAADLKYDVDDLVSNPANHMEFARSVTSEDLKQLIQDNIEKYCQQEVLTEDSTDGGVNNLNLTRAVIDAFTQTNVIEAVKENLISRLSDI